MFKIALILLGITSLYLYTTDTGFWLDLIAGVGAISVGVSTLINSYK